MFRNFKNLFSRKQKAIEDEIALKSKINGVLSIFLREDILKKADIECQLSYSINKGVIKIETDNKIIAQEVALRIRVLEQKLRSEGVVFRKLLI